MGIDLNDPKLYESHALSQSLAFFERHLLKYNALSPEGLETHFSDLCSDFTRSHSEKIQSWRKHRCEVCDQELNGDKQLQEHLQTRKHKNAVHRQWKLEHPEAHQAHLQAKHEAKLKVKAEAVTSQEASDETNFGIGDFE